jgi:hypothetical protein
LGILGPSKSKNDCRLGVTQLNLPNAFGIVFTASMLNAIRNQSTKRKLELLLLSLGNGDVMSIFLSGISVFPKPDSTKIERENRKIQN